MKRYRAFRRRADGAWLDVLITAGSDDVDADGDDVDPSPEFGCSADDQAADLAAALGVEPDELEVIEGDTDPRDDNLVEVPTSPPSADEIRREQGRDAALDLKAIAQDTSNPALVRRVARDTLLALRATWAEVQDVDVDAG